MKAIYQPWLGNPEPFKSVADMYKKYPTFKNIQNVYKDTPKLYTIENNKKVKHFRY